MALSGSRLNTALATDILAQLNTAFPTNASLQAGEKTAADAAKVSLANAIAAAVGPDVVTEITGHAVVPLGQAVATTGTATAQTGTVTSPGTVT